LQGKFYQKAAFVRYSACQPPYSAYIPPFLKKYVLFLRLLSSGSFIFATGCKLYFQPVAPAPMLRTGDGIDYRKSTKIVYFRGCMKQVPIRSEIDNKLTTAVVKSYIWKRKFTKAYSNATSENGYNARIYGYLQKAAEFIIRDSDSEGRWFESSQAHHVVKPFEAIQAAYFYS